MGCAVVALIWVTLGVSIVLGRRAVRYVHLFNAPYVLKSGSTGGGAALGERTVALLWITPAARARFTRAPGVEPLIGVGLSVRALLPAHIFVVDRRPALTLLAGGGSCGEATCASSCSEVSRGRRAPAEPHQLLADGGGDLAPPHRSVRVTCARGRRALAAR